MSPKIDNFVVIITTKSLVHNLENGREQDATLNMACLEMLIMEKAKNFENSSIAINL